MSSMFFQATSPVAPARLADLVRLGLDTAFVERLAKIIGGTTDLPLTRFQAEALCSPALLEPSANIVVAGPTSAGKTLVATILTAMMRRASPKRKIVYMVPLRALVTEKANEWKELFVDARVLPVSSDYPRSDHLVRSGAWDLAVVVFEKVYQWLGDPELCTTIVPQLGLVVADELQLVGEPGRGEKLEMILTLLRHEQERSRATRETLPFRMLGMGVSREIAAGLQQWLGAELVPSRSLPRPIPLLEVKVKKGGSYVVYGESKLAPLAPEEIPLTVRALFGPAPAPGALALVRRAMACGLRVLLYVASRLDAMDTAHNLAKLLPNPGIHPSLVDELEQLEDSSIVADLRTLLTARVGVHHGHMTPAERAVVERGFRSLDTDTPVQLLVATRTLGMGVNLPADVVVLKDLHNGRNSRRSANDDPSARKLTVADYRNFAGRAGRLRPNLSADAIGLVALYDRGGAWKGVADELLCGTVTSVPSSLGELTFGATPHAITSLAFHESFHRSGTPEERVGTILDDSYLRATHPALPADVVDSFSHELGQLRGLDIIGEGGLTGPGRAIARFGLSLPALEALIRIARAFDEWWPAPRLALIHELCATPELRLLLHRSASTEYEIALHAREIRAYWDVFIDRTELLSSSPLVRWLALDRPADQGAVDVPRFIKAVALHQWSQGVPIRRLLEFATPSLQRAGHVSERRHRSKHAVFSHVSLGQLSDAGEMTAAMVGALRQLVEQLDTEREPHRNARLTQELWLWEQSLRHGVSLQMVVLPIIVAYATNERMHRKFVEALFNAIDRPGDPRIWRDKPRPPTIRPRVWEAFQAGLRWWQDSVGDWCTGEHEAGLIKGALERLVQQADPEAPLAAPSEPRTVVPQNVVAVSRHATPAAEHGERPSAERVEADALDRVVACRARQDLERLVSQELQREPLSATVRPLARPTEWHHPTWQVLLGPRIVPVALRPGKLRAVDLGPLRRVAREGPALVVVSGEIAPDVLEIPRAVRSIVSAHVVVALCRWAQHRPADLSIVRDTLMSEGRVLRRVADALSTPLK